MTAVGKPAVKYINLAFVLFLLTAPGAQADYEAGEAAAKRGDYAAAYGEFLPLAKEGHVRAQHNIGLIYERGFGRPKDYALAANWYRFAAKQGLANSQNNLGGLYRTGTGVRQDYAKAAYWYGKAAEQGHAMAQNSFGDLYRKGQGVTRDYAAALKWYRASAEQGQAWGLLNLGRMYEMGQGVSRDYAKALKWYRAAAKQGLPAVQLYNLHDDPKEKHNLQADQPELVKQLTADLRRIVEQGRSTPGPKQPNHAGATWWSGLPWKKP